MGRDSLERYRAKRNFTLTKEPEGVMTLKKGYRYLIQKHAATRLHYDFRLELDGVLKSWAVTRGPSLDPQEKRLAVEVEDHPVSYGSFEGTIPKGQYGGGTVMLWDEGTWEPIGDPRKGLAKGKLEFNLYGERLKGEWVLVRMHEREKDKGHHNWLLIKRHDENARPDDEDSYLEENKTSIVSGRAMEKIAAAGDNVWQSKPAATRSQIKPKAQAKKQTYVKSTLPRFITPELATLTDTLPQGKEWLYEVKFDGYRALTYIENGSARVFTRTGQDWTEKFHSIAALAADMKVNSAILDGEIVALNKDGISSFSELQKSLKVGGGNLQYYIFDLLYLNGKKLTEKSLLERKLELSRLLHKPINQRIIYSEHFTARDAKFFDHICDMQMEGVISKRADSLYQSGRTKAWLKTKCHKRQEFVVGGFTLPTHTERGVGALLIGYYREEELVYAGKVGTGFDNVTSLQLRKKLDGLKQDKMAFTSVTADGRRGARWVKPELVCEVEFTEWTEDGHLRHPSFQGLREDKPAQAVERDVPLEKKAIKAVKVTTSKTTKSKDVLVEGIKISHHDRIIYPGHKITKLQLAQYYAEVGETMMPYIKGRPLSMLRCPEGTEHACFFQRHISSGQSPYLHDTGIKVKDRNESYLMIKDIQGLITLAQWGVIEVHSWGCHADKPQLPDQMIFDLDPDPALSWKYVIEGAEEIRDRMKELGLESFLKTTGGKGLHVVIPMTRDYEWPVIKAFAKAIAVSMQQDKKDRYISTSSKVTRTGKIFVDYLRNDLTSTAIAPFSARAREGATVSLPISWQELSTKLDPKSYTIESVPALLQKRKHDPWEDFFTLKQKLSSKHLRALKILI